MIHAVSEVGDMVDFLKAFPFVSMEEYLWGLSSPKIRIMSFDNSHVEHLSEKAAKSRKARAQGLHIGGEHGFGLTNDLGNKIM